MRAGLLTIGVAGWLWAASAQAQVNAGPLNTDPAPRSAPAMVPVGKGTTDPSPRQMVRTSGDVLYVVAPSGTVYTSTPPTTAKLSVFGGNRAGTPTSFIPLDPTHAPGGGVNTSASAIDGADRIHSVWVTPGKLGYGVFDTQTKLWTGVRTLATTGWTSYGQGDEGAAIAVDAQGNPYAVWNYVDPNGTLRLRLAIARNGVFGAPQPVDDVDAHGGARHPSVGFAPNGDFVVAWIDGDGGYYSPGAVRTRVLHPDGTWEASVTVPGEAAGSSLDQSCSLLITPDGVRHLTFLNTENVIRYVYDRGQGWVGDQQPPAQVTHDPVLGPDGRGGLYIYGHATPEPDSRGLGDGKYRFHKAAGATAWSPYSLVIDGYIDDASNARWSQFFHNHPEEVDFTWWNHNPQHDLNGGGAGYYIEAGVETAAGPILAGATDLLPAVDQNVSGTAEAFANTAAASGTAGRIGVFLDVSGSSTQVRVGLYSDAAGRPGSLLAQGLLSGVTAGAGQWHEAALTATPALTAGRTYWIAILSTAADRAVAFRDTPSGALTATSASTTLKALPAAWTTGATYADGPAAAYVVGK